MLCASDRLLPLFSPPFRIVPRGTIRLVLFPELFTFNPAHSLSRQLFHVEQFAIRSGIGPEADGLFRFPLSLGLGCCRFSLFCSGAGDLVALHVFLREIKVGLGAARARIVERYGSTVTGSLGQADIARDDRFEEAVFEEVPKRFRDL